MFQYYNKLVTILLELIDVIELMITLQGLRTVREVPEDCCDNARKVWGA
ncbi:agno [Betapolyomavirus canis]|uniref:Agno n=1 Tax=Betapolyomavirus canis TaxID=1980633 RepID=A0A1W6EU84_9POLY|nr:agno [Betapolyomavirus canis]ARK19238.1 agno [Betapolyomavirus canis]